LREYWFSLLHFLFSKRKWKVFFEPLSFQKKVEKFLFLIFQSFS